MKEALQLSMELGLDPGSLPQERLLAGGGWRVMTGGDAHLPVPL